VTRANGNVKTHFKERRYASGRWLDARHQAMLCVDRSIQRHPYRTTRSRGSPSFDQQQLSSIMTC
jgi:hypothetical protein